MTKEQQQYYTNQFYSLQKNSYGNIHGLTAKAFFEKSGLKHKDLSHIWQLSDIDQDGQLSLPEFCIAMHLIVLRRNQIDLPQSLPMSLRFSHRSSLVNFSSSSSSSSIENNEKMDNSLGMIRNNAVIRLNEKDLFTLPESRNRF